jgi:hypothetical protein
MGRAKRTDANQAAIVKALRDVGASVGVMSDLGRGMPDLMVGYTPPNGKPQTYLLEVKTAAGKLTADEHKWHMLWRGQVAIVRSVEDALRVIGVEVTAN